MIGSKCRRGDVIAWAQRHDYAYLDNRLSEAEPIWHIGIVTSVTRDGVVKTADDGLGRATVYHNLGSAAVRREMIDADKARAWLRSDANYPRAGSAPLRSLDDARAIVRQWLKGAP